MILLLFSSAPVGDFAIAINAGAYAVTGTTTNPKRGLRLQACMTLTIR